MAVGPRRLWRSPDADGRLFSALVHQPLLWVQAHTPVRAPLRSARARQALRWLQAAASRRSPDSRRDRRTAAGGLFCLFGLLVLGAVAWGRPHVASHLRPSDNRLVVRVVRGGGPLAALLFSPSSLEVDGHRAKHDVILQLEPGRTVHTAVSVTSLWSTTDHLVVRVPPKPAIVRTTMTDNAVTLSFSTRVRVGDEACGLQHRDAWTTTLRFPRRIDPCSTTLGVIAHSGERGSFPVSVPPVPLPILLQKGAWAAPAPEISFGPPGGGAFYITIDDGWVPSPQLLDLMQRTHIPITAFLISNAVTEHLDYWRRFLAAGGDIEDHTVTHPNLASLGQAGAETQWLGAAQAYASWFGITCTLGRPPYGGVNAAVRSAATAAGLRYVVMWSAAMVHGQFVTYDGKPLRAGEIVILHWVPGVYDEVVRLLAMAHAEGLHPAPLRAGLGLQGAPPATAVRAPSPVRPARARNDPSGAAGR